jgi:hypothetical protein
MALQITIAADLMTVAICKACALNPDGTAIPNQLADNSTFPSDFANAYNTYAKQGVVLGAENTGGNTSILSGVLTRTTHVAVDEFALAFAQFWSTVAVSPGPPGHGGSGVNAVENDALSKVGLFKQAIEMSLTTVESKPYYHRFLRNLENIAVKAILWKVTEVIPAGPTDFFEPIA